MGFGGLDYAVLFLYLAATAAFGLRIGRDQGSLQAYFLGRRSLPWWAVCFSIVATETSTLTFIGAPAIAYDGNLTFLQVAFGYILGRILVTLILLPGYFRGHIVSAYEVLQRSLGTPVRNFSAFLFQSNRLLADGVRLFATALVLSVVTRISDFWTVVLIGLITVIYTYYGGLVAVVWNDVVQLAVYVGGALIAAWILLDQIPGGWDQMIVTAGQAGKLQIFDFELLFSRPYTLWGGVIGGAFLTFATHGTDQMMVQRYLACRNLSQSRRALILSGLLVFFQFLLFLLIGIMLYVYYLDVPIGREVTQSNEIFPIFIVDKMPAGVAGLIIAAVFAAAMSTLSSSLNSLSASFVNDYYRPILAPGKGDRHYLQVSRIATVGWAVALILVSQLAKQWGEVLQAGLTITSIVMGSVLGAFLLANWNSRSSGVSTLIGMVSGLLGVLTIASAFPTAIAWTWFVLIGTSITFCVGSFCALFFPRVPAGASK